MLILSIFHVSRSNLKHEAHLLEGIPSAFATIRLQSQHTVGDHIGDTRRYLLISAAVKEWMECAVGTP